MAKAKGIRKLPATSSTEELEREIQLRKSQTFFPLEVFDFMRDYVDDLVSIGVDRNSLGAGLLAVISAAVGAVPKWRYKKQTGFCSLWVVIIGKKATGKGYTDGFIMNKIKSMNLEYRRKHSDNPHKLLFYSDANQYTLKQQVMSENPRGVMFHLPEFTMLMDIMDNEKKEASWYLAKWDNDGESIPRKNSSYTMLYSYITIYGGTQPHQIERIFGKGRSSDGTVERILFSTIYNDKGYEEEGDAEPNEIHHQQFAEHIQSCYELFTVDTYDNYRAIFYDFDVKTFKLYEAWALNIQKLCLLDLDDNRALLMRYKVYFKKICVLLQIFEGLYNGVYPNGEYIEEAIAKKAIKVINYFYYEFVNVSKEKAPEDARIIAMYVKKGWSNKKIAEILGVSEMTVLRKKKQYQEKFNYLFYDK